MPPPPAATRTPSKTHEPAGPLHPACAGLGGAADRGGLGPYYQFRSKYLESTNDAFVQADSVTVSSKVTGYVDQVLVADNQIVKAGQPLVRIDARDYSAQAAQAKAQIDAASASEKRPMRNWPNSRPPSQAKAQLAAADEDARFATAEVERYTPWPPPVPRTRERLTTLRNQQARSHHGCRTPRRAGCRTAAGAFAAGPGAPGPGPGETAKAQYDAASVNLGYTEIRASVDGASVTSRCASAIRLAPARA
jgi:membrane fusion protein (multidrug efflux system)